jgi:hypothetical protein
MRLIEDILNYLVSQDLEFVLLFQINKRPLYENQRVGLYNVCIFHVIFSSKLYFYLSIVPHDKFSNFISIYVREIYYRKLYN